MNTMNIERLLALEQEEVTNRRRLPSTNPPVSPMSSTGAGSHSSSSAGVNVIFGHSGNQPGRVEQVCVPNLKCLNRLIPILHFEIFEGIA